MAKDSKFPPKKVILFGKIRKSYTQVLHCFNHAQEFNKRPNHIEFQCKECVNEGRLETKVKLTISIHPKADFTNSHGKLKEWYDLINDNDVDSDVDDVTEND